MATTNAGSFNLQRRFPGLLTADASHRGSSWCSFQSPKEIPWPSDQACDNPTQNHTGVFQSPKEIPWPSDLSPDPPPFSGLTFQSPKEIPWPSDLQRTLADLT